MCDYSIHSKSAGIVREDSNFEVCPSIPVLRCAARADRSARWEDSYHKHQSLVTCLVPESEGAPAEPMFSQAFQNGPSVSVFVPKGSKPPTGWALSRTVRKRFNKEVRGCVGAQCLWAPRCLCACVSVCAARTGDVDCLTHPHRVASSSYGVHVRMVSLTFVGTHHQLRVHH